MIGYSYQQEGVDKDIVGSIMELKDSWQEYNDNISYQQLTIDNVWGGYKMIIVVWYMLPCYRVYAYCYPLRI